MLELDKYRKQHLSQRSTRVEMLLMIYDKAIAELEACDAIDQAKDPAHFGQHLTEAYKALLAIQTGLKPEEDEVAFNIARLLHFVLAAVEQQNFSDAIKVLEELRQGFVAVEKEAVQLEKEGVISPMPDADNFQETA